MILCGMIVGLAILRTSLRFFLLTLKYLVSNVSYLSSADAARTAVLSFLSHLFQSLQINENRKLLFAKVKLHVGMDVLTFEISMTYVGGSTLNLD